MTTKRRSDERESQPHVSRRTFLKTSGVAVAAASVPLASVASQVGTPAATPGATPVHGTSSGLPSGALEFFNDDQAAVIEALTARILPGTVDDPGAKEAGVVFYIDRRLHGAEGGYSLKTYKQGPYLVVPDQETPTELTSRPTIYDVRMVDEATLATRYGYQSVMTPQEIYRRGIDSVLTYAQSKFKSEFSTLTDDQLDEMLEDMEADKADAFDAPSGSAFFSLLRNDTIEGMFSDPMYGGNRDMAGWKLIGYPGPRGFYTADELVNPDFHIAPISLADMDSGSH